MADLRNTRLSIYLRNRLLNGFGLADFNGATIKFYTTAQPATPETALGAQTLLVTDTMANPAFPAAAAAGGVATANAIVSGVAAATGTPTWARITDSGGTNVLCDCEVGASSDANTDNIELPAVSITAGVTVGLSSFTITLPMQGL